MIVQFNREFWDFDPTECIMISDEFWDTGLKFIRFFSQELFQLIFKNRFKTEKNSKNHAEPTKQVIVNFGEYFESLGQIYLDTEFIWNTFPNMTQISAQLTRGVPTGISDITIF